jgi:hypothetical protein
MQNFKDPIIYKKKAIERFGTGAALGKWLGVSRQAVCVWPDVLPPLIAYRLVQTAPDLAEKDHTPPEN